MVLGQPSCEPTMQGISSPCGVHLSQPPAEELNASRCKLLGGQLSCRTGWTCLVGDAHSHSFSCVLLAREGGKDLCQGASLSAHSSKQECTYNSQNSASSVRVLEM